MTKSILIVGAGPVGLSAAVELHRHGFRPRIVDKADGHPPESRALAIHARTLQLLEDSGVTQRLIDRGNRVDKFCLSEFDSDRGVRELFTVDISRDPPPFNFLITLPQTDTERVLAQRLSETGIPIEWKTEVNDLAMNNGRARVQLVGPSGEQRVTPDFVIGADGAHSFVRDRIGSSFHGRRRESPFALMDANLHQPIDTTAFQIWFTPNGLMARFPMRETFVRYVATDPKDLVNPPGHQNIAERTWKTDFHISFRHVDSFQNGNVFLAGDAAHIHSPIGGRGMNLGIEDAAWLAWLIKNGNESQYTKHRLPVAKFTLRQTERQTAQALSTGWSLRMLRRYLAPTMLKFPPIRRFAHRTLRALDTPKPPWLGPR